MGKSFHVSVGRKTGRLRRRGRGGAQPKTDVFKPKATNNLVTQQPIKPNYRLKNGGLGTEESAD
jgi:hypothetical protein